MVAIVYSRVSSEDQARSGFSLASQVDSGRRRAAELGAGEVITFADEGVPGDVLGRPGLQGALEAARQGGVTLFICHDPDRLARSLSLQLLITDQIERAGVRLEFVNFEYNQTPEGQLFYSLRGAIAQFEKAKIRERTMRGKRQKARTGGLTHNPSLYGYDFDPVTDTLRVNEQQARVVRMVFHWFLTEDLGPLAIARRLTGLGISPARGGAAWHHASVRAMLANPSYTGVLQQQKWDCLETRINKYRAPGEKVKRRLRPESDWVPVAIPALIDGETHRAALSRLEQARRWWSGTVREWYLLKGLCRCALCGRPVSGASRRSGRGRLRYYVCRGYAPGAPGEPRCALGRVRADAVEAEVWQVVRTLAERAGRPAAAATFAEPDPTEEKDLCRAQLERLQAELERTARLVVRGSLDQELGERLLAEQQGRLRQVQQRLARLQEAAQAPEPIAEEDKARTLPEALPFPVRQQILRALVKSVELSPAEIVVTVRLTPAGVALAIPSSASR
jgi:site-specific DNA recombinase